MKDFSVQLYQAELKIKELKEFCARDEKDLEDAQTENKRLHNVCQAKDKAIQRAINVLTDMNRSHCKEVQKSTFAFIEKLESYIG